MITELNIQNFTAFQDVNLSLSPKVNVVLGTNGAGKTHLLKALYGLCLAPQNAAAGKSEKDSIAATTSKFVRVFTPEAEKIGNLHAKGSKGPTKLSLKTSDAADVAISFSARSSNLKIDHNGTTRSDKENAVFIPTKEVLSLVRGMMHPDYHRETVESIFDDGYIDLANLLIRPDFEDEATTISEDPRLSSVIRELVELVGGRYHWQKEGTFSFDAGKYVEKPNPDRSKSKSAQIYQDSTVWHFEANGKQSFSSGMTAEGYRKIGVLHRLLCNGSINPGVTGPLLWDEPEANLNPKLMKKVVQVLLELSRNGQQVILATHDYVLLKWFDLLMDRGKEDHVRFHALFRDQETGSVRVESADSYSLISKSAISDTFAELFDEDLARALGGGES